MARTAVRESEETLVGAYRRAAAEYMSVRGRQHTGVEILDAWCAQMRAWLALSRSEQVRLSAQREPVGGEERGGQRRAGAV